MKSKAFLLLLYIALIFFVLSGCAKSHTPTGDSSASSVSSASDSLSLPILFFDIPADQTGYHLKLQFIEGKLVTKDSPDYAPGGGMAGLMFDKNYIGKYELIISKDGQALSSITVSLKRRTHK